MALAQSPAAKPTSLFERLRALLVLLCITLTVTFTATRSPSTSADSNALATPAPIDQPPYSIPSVVEATPAVSVVEEAKVTSAPSVPLLAKDGQPLWAPPYYAGNYSTPVELMVPFPTPPPLPKAPRKMAVGDGACTYVLDNAVAGTIPPLSEQYLNLCGGPVTQRATAIPKAADDPMLKCSYHISSLYAGSLTDFVWQAPFVPDGKSDPPHNKLHLVFSDWGCFTAHRMPRYSMLSGMGQEIPVVVGLVDPRVIDAGSFHYVAHYRTREMDLKPAHAIFDSAKGTAASVNASKLVQHIATAEAVAYTAMGVANPRNISTPPTGLDVVRFGALWEAEIKRLQWQAAPKSAAPRVPFEQLDFYGGHVASITLKYVSIHYIGQVFQEFMAYAARLYSSGLLDLPGVRLVIPKYRHDDDEPFRSWLYPYLKVPVIIHNPDRVALMQVPWSVSLTGYEVTEPCVDLFVSYRLLPMILKDLRKDVAGFPYGSAAVRNDSRKSDMEWLATFPKKIAILKDLKSARHHGAFPITDRVREMFAAAGFVMVSDRSPFTHRLALINAADVLAVSWGALFSMMSRLFGGPYLRPTRPLRMIVLTHPRYKSEDEWAAPRAGRHGWQGRARVVVSQSTTLAPVFSWAKFIFTDEISFEDFLLPEHLSFEPRDCTLDPSRATDFESYFVRVANTTLPRTTFRQLNRSWEYIPKYGQRCRIPDE